jgi:hypothetical protein
VAALKTPIPTQVEDINLTWFKDILSEPVLAANVLEVIHGTATKVKVELQLAQKEGPATSAVVWVKTGMEPHSKQIGTERVYAGETLFYRDYGGKYETRAPRCYYAESDDKGNSVLVLDDLCKLDAQFTEPAIAGSPDRIAHGLEAIARYQAASWMDPALAQADWLRRGGSFDIANCLDWIYDPAHWELYSKRPRFQLLAPALRNRDKLLRAHTNLRTRWLRREPWALSHGDAHYGQLYSLPSGECRLIDWQCVCIANYSQDPTNLMVSGLSVADRRACEVDLWAHYVRKLAEFGVKNPPSVQEALESMRIYLMHQVSWVMCLVEMQPEENCCAITERASAAAMDHGTVDLLLTTDPG